VSDRPERPDRPDRIVGIDLGTTNSVVATVQDDQPVVLADDKGFKIQPSVVSFHPNGSVVVGAEAKQRRIIDPRNTVYSAKRLIGRTFKSREVASSAARMPYKIKEGVNEQPVIVTRAGEFAVPEIAAIVLDHMRSIARKALDDEVGRAVITVPANFTDAQRSATATAGAIAGLTVVRVLNEPTAAALAYGRGRTVNQTIAVYDFGGGTFDVTVLRLQDEVYEVLGTAGDTFLGGDDIDERLVDHMVQTFLRDTRTDLRGDELAMQRLRAVAEQTKIELSRRSRAIIKVDEIAYGPGGTALDLTLEIARDEFVSRIADLVDKTFPVCQEALRAAGAEEVDEIVLVGGTTKMPYVRQRVTNFFGKAPRTDVNPDEAVAIGAAIQADALARVLSGGQRPTARRSVAPPAPPMEVKPQGSGPIPPPTPADAVARKFAPPPRHTAPRFATTEQRHAQEPIDTIVVDDEEPTGVLGRPQAAAATAADEEPTGIRPRPPQSRTTEPSRVPPPPSAARPPPVIPQGRRTLPGAAPIARITRPGTAPPGAGVDTNVATNPGPAPAESLMDLIDTSVQTDPAEASTDETTNVQTDPGHVTKPEPARPKRISIESLGLDTQVQPEPSAPRSKAPVVLDVVPQGLGIGTVAGFCEELVHRHSRVPCEQTRKFSTSADYQTTVNIRVCLGDSRRIADNVILGQVVLEGIPKQPRGRPSIAVTFRVDESGILNVSARDEETGAEQQATLHLLGAPSGAEVEAAKQRFRNLVDS
jgi:molecular chaperone DnaK